MKNILTVFGTRPEAIKVSPVIWSMKHRQHEFNSVNVCSSQHTDLLAPFLRQLNIEVHHDLKVMSEHQTPTCVLNRVIDGMRGILTDEQPDMVLVQGDTTTALAGALAASYEGVPVGHIEAGLRTGNRRSPFPEELNRRLIAQAADLHFAATRKNVDALIREGIAEELIVKTGNPVVDSLKYILNNRSPSGRLRRLLHSVDGRRLLVLTTHRRENFGDIMERHLKAIRRFVNRHDEVAVVFPVHPNPNVRAMAQKELSDHERIHLVEPFGYSDFVHLLSKAWLLASDSGGIVEEAPTLGKPVIVLRDTTERPEAVDCGIAKLAGHCSETLDNLLEEALSSDDWSKSSRLIINPFGSGDAGRRIVNAISTYFGLSNSVHPIDEDTQFDPRDRRAQL